MEEKRPHPLNYELGLRNIDETDIRRVKILNVCRRLDV